MDIKLLFKDKEIDEKYWRELRCPRCRKMICEECIYDGWVRVECPQCKLKWTQRFKDIKDIMKEVRKNG